MVRGPDAPLRWLLENHGSRGVGTPCFPWERFWLIKILDARDDLSYGFILPPTARRGLVRRTEDRDVVSRRRRSRGQNLRGLKPGVTRGEFEQRVADGTVAGCFSRGNAFPRRWMMFDSGRVHALGGGSVGI